MAQEVILVLCHELRGFSLSLSIEVPQFCLLGTFQLQFLILMCGDEFVH